MLEHIPAWLGSLLQSLRAGHDKLVIAQPDIAATGHRIELSSPAFGPGGRLPERFTADGAGVSPPLVWGRLPARTASLALIVEDPDAPSFHPLVHAIAWHISPDEHGLTEGALSLDGPAAITSAEVGRNSFLSSGWLPPDPPTGHGSHDYVFQLFALNDTPAIGGNPGRAAFIDGVAGRILAAGLLIGTYSRGETARPAADRGQPTAAPA